jgi:hypothetical protein
MSDNTEFDPFNQPEGAQGADVNDAVPAGDDVLAGVDLDAELDDLFAGAEMELEEEESDEEVRVYEAGNTYVNPLDVGLKDKMWVPIRISVAEFKEKHTPRLSSKVCVAVKVGEDGKKRVYVPFDQVEAALQTGATEVVTEMELPYFICEANHVAPEFGQRRYPYEIESPALTIKTAFFKEPRSGRKGYKNEDGRTLRVAASATQPGEKVSLKTMPEIAKRIEGKIVMACISLSTKTKTRPRLDGNNQPINVLVDPETGAPVTVFSPQDGTGYILNDGSGQVWEGNEKLLVKVDDRVYAIADRGENSAPLMEEYAQTTDYLKTKFLPVPERKVEVELRNGETVKGEITWGTVGAIAQDKTPGVFVDVMLGAGAGDMTGKTITAVWLGTQWTEVAKDGEGEGGGLDEFAGAKNL